jgi:uracil-DNA glycosylase
MKFDEGWIKFLSQEIPKPYFSTLAGTVQNQRNEGKKICPAEGRVFEAFKLTPFTSLKAVIVGYEPYSSEGLSHGLAYSVPDGVPITPVLKNIYKELSTSLKVPEPTTGNLDSWAKGGILLLNSVLTVEVDKPKSHRGLGWEEFTSNCLKYISDNKEERVTFCLWGREAQTKSPYINRKKHLVLKTSSPDPLTANQGFTGSGHFVNLNQVTRIWG